MAASRVRRTSVLATTVDARWLGDVAHARSDARAEPGQSGDKALTIGVEEEFLLVDPRTGLLAPRADAVIRSAARPDQVVAESMAYMVETRTHICRSTDEVVRDLTDTRRRVSEAASQHGVACLPYAVPPFGAWPDPPLLSDGARYREVVRRFPREMVTSGTCACHVHVGVPDRATGVQVLLRLRPWLPALLALTAASPVHGGRDTGWASQRLRLVSRWPTGAPVPPVTSLAAYDRTLRGLVARGRALDERSVYFFARLSPRYPTVELRVADVGAAVEDTTAFAALVRGLVAAALDDHRRGRPVPRVPQSRLLRSCIEVARSGPSRALLDPVTNRASDVCTALAAPATAAGPWLREVGDEERVLAALERMRATGGGAARTRRLFAATSSPEAFVSALSTAMTADGRKPPRERTGATPRGRQRS